MPAPLASAGVAPAARTAARAGFTLLEVLVALALLTGVFLAVAQVLAAAARAADRSRATALGAVLASQKMEQLRALAWAYDTGGATIDGLGLSPPGALGADAAGFVDYFDGTGTPVAGGPPAPMPAAFARRWSVEPDASMAPPAALMLRVAVWYRGPPGSATGPGASGWAEVARIAGARTRRPS